ncbi:MAG: hypothetical protein ACI8WB_001661 [Phenylobacterium sp.]|jgi:hypothetical protein
MVIYSTIQALVLLRGASNEQRKRRRFSKIETLTAFKKIGQKTNLKTLLSEAFFVGGIFSRAFI